ncbi:NTPase, partial [Reticulomyxa filosa]
MEEKYSEETRVNEVSEVKGSKKDTNATTEKLMRYYKSQDKLAPLFDDPGQPIDNCYIRLALLTQQQFQGQKDKITNNEKENENWQNSLDYSLIYENKTETIEVQDIWNDAKGSNIRHISIRGEAGSGKSVLSQRIAYLWGKHQMCNDQFQWLLHIPLRKLVNIFDNSGDENKEDIENQWLNVFNALRIPQWNTHDTKYIINSKNGLLLLDGFDEIANEIDKNTGLQQWLQHCTANENYFVIMTSRPNAMYSCLNNPRMLNVIGFQSQDIRNYVYAYFKNIQIDDNNNSQADLLIKKLNDNPSLKLLSHTPLYLRLFCYLTKQNKSLDKDKLDNMSLSKLYETLLKSYMKWNWMKSNGTISKLNEEMVFTIFEMEIDYLSHLAWEGLKCGQAVISCEIQQKILHIIKNKYPRQDISVISQWSRIHSFGFLQGQESIDPSHPMDPVYFPHLTFQEWLAAYYLVNCLYESSESDNHQQVCSILINQQITPKYAVMIPFMAGILYNNIENKKDPSGSGLLYFWKLLHSSPPQPVSIHQKMLHMHCLDACKADTESPFLPLKLQTCHKTLVDSFKSLLITWIYFFKNEYYRSQPLHNVMKLHLSNFQHLFKHPDIHLCIIDQLKEIQTQLNRFGVLIPLETELDTLYYYLCISTETSNIVVQCYQKTVTIGYRLYMDLYCEILGRLNERQLDDVLEFLMHRISDKDRGTHNNCADSLANIALNLNERQLNKVFKFLMNAFDDGKIQICDECAHTLAMVSLQLGGKQLDNVFQYLINRFHEYFYYLGNIQFIMKLKEEQLDRVFKCWINRLPDKNNFERQRCANFLETFSMKWNEKQLNDAFNSLMDRLNDKSENEYMHEACISPLLTIAVKLGKKQTNDAFNYLMNGLNNENEDGYLRKECIRSLLTIAVKLDGKQFDDTFNYLMNGFQNRKNYIYKDPYLLEIIAMKLNETQVDAIFTCLINGFKDNNENIRVFCAQSIGHLTTKLNERHLSDAFQHLINGLKDNNLLTRRSCADALGDISVKLNESQLEKVFNSLIDLLNHLIDLLNQENCYSYLRALHKISVKLNDKQLYLLTKSVLKREKKGNVRDGSLTISEDMWRRATVYLLKKKTKAENKEMKLFAFGLLEYHPRIQLNCNDDNITLDALKELTDYCNEQASKRGYSYHQLKWDHGNEDIAYPCFNNDILQFSNDESLYKGRYTVLHEAARSGDLSQLKLVLQNDPYLDINNSCNEHRQTPLHLAIKNKHWDVARYCIEKGAWIDVREGAVNASIFRTPFENLMELIMKYKNDKSNKEYLDAMNICKWILKQRTIYPMKRIEYAIDYVKDKLVDEEGIIKSIDEESYETLLQEGATFLLGLNQKDLKETVIKIAENANKKRFDEGWYPLPFLITRIFLLFEICVRLKRERRGFIGLPKGTTFEQVYEKGMKELQVQLTTYWDYIITDEFKHKCPDLIEDWSCNVVDRLMNMKTISPNKYNEMSLV